MDLMIDFVRDRTEELQRVAADLRRTREPEASAPRASEPASVAAALATPRLVEQPATEPACGDRICPPASARPAA